MRISELSKYSFPEPLIESWRSQGIEKLLPIQDLAIKQFDLFNGGSFLVSAPTSSGKTFIGELAGVFQGLKGRKTVYLVPLKALAEEKFAQFRQLYEPYGIRVVVSSRDRREYDEALFRDEYEIAIIVYEKFFQLLNTTPKFMSLVGLVVVDELQLLADATRGATVELILTALKLAEGQFQIIGLTAVLGNNRQVNEWLEVDLLHYERRPVELRIGYLWKGVFHYRTYNDHETGVEKLFEGADDDGGEALEKVITVLANRGEQSLVFVQDKETARGIARRLASQIDLEPAEEALTELSELETTVSNEELARTLQKGIAFHHADLTPEERSLVERHFRSETIKILISTTTLAMGVNLPTRNVFIQLEKWHTDPGDSRPRSIPLPKSEFENMSGRAGRFQLEDEFGRAMAVLTRPIECDQFRNIYLDGKLEDIEPNLWRDSMATAVLGMVALGRCGNLDEVRKFLRNTLTWHLYRKDGVEQAILDKNLEQGIADCLQVGVLLETSDKRLILTELGKVISANGIRVETGSILKSWLERRGDSAFTATEAILAAVITPDGQEAYLNMSTSEFKQIGDHYQRMIQEILGGGLFRLFGELIDYRLDGYQTIKAFKTALLLSDYIGVRSAQYLEERYQTYFGAIKRVAEHISWVLNSAAALVKAMEYPKSWMETLFSLADQVQYGLPPEGIRLAQLRVPRLGRERIRSLIKEGAISDRDILEAGEEFIAELTTKPVARQLFRRIQDNQRPSSEQTSTSSSRVIQRDNSGTVVVGVNNGTIIVGNARAEETAPKEAPETEDLTGLKTAEWQKAVRNRVDDLNPVEIKELYEHTRELHHNLLRPAIRDLAHCSTLAELKSALKDLRANYQVLTEALQAKLSAVTLPDYAEEFNALSEPTSSLMEAQSRVGALGNNLLRKVARMVNLLEEFKTSPEAMLEEALKSLASQIDSLEIDQTGLQPESDQQEGFYRKRKIADAFRNIISNAIDSLRETSDPRLILSSEVSGGLTALNITDNGGGISEPDRERIFKDGFSGKGSTGFGLGYARRVFESHGGSLRLVESNPGVSTTFEVVI